MPIATPSPTFASESELQAAIIKQAKLWGWKQVYHTYDSRRSEEGFPDLVMVRRDRIIFAELKKNRQLKPSRAQQLWLRALQFTGKVEVYVWSPEDWDFILKTLS